MSNLVTLATGEVVDSADPAWRDECLTRHRHVQSMRSLGLEGRRDYLARVKAAEGEIAAQRLREAFAKDWDERKAAEQRTKEAMKP